MKKLLLLIVVLLSLTIYSVNAITYHTNLMLYDDFESYNLGNFVNNSKWLTFQNYTAGIRQIITGKKLMLDMSDGRTTFNFANMTTLARLSPNSDWSIVYDLYYNPNPGFYHHVAGYAVSTGVSDTQIISGTQLGIDRGYMSFYDDSATGGEFYCNGTTLLNNRTWYNINWTILRNGTIQGRVNGTLQLSCPLSSQFNNTLQSPKYLTLYNAWYSNDTIDNLYFTQTIGNCSDEIQNGDEQCIDGGGSCPISCVSNNIPSNTNIYMSYILDGIKQSSLNSPSNPIAANSWQLNFTAVLSSTISSQLNLVACSNIALTYSACNILCASPFVTNNSAASCLYTPGSTGGFNRTAYIYTNGSWSNYTTIPYYVSTKGGDIPVFYNSTLPFFINTSRSATITNPYTLSCASGNTCSYNYTVRITNNAGIGNYTLFAYDSNGTASFNSVIFEVKAGANIPTINTNLSSYTNIDWTMPNFDINVTLATKWNETPQCSIQNNVSWISCAPVNATIGLDVNYTKFTCYTSGINTEVVSMYANCTSPSWEINSSISNINIDTNTHPSVITNISNYAPNMTNRIFNVNVSGFNWSQAQNPACVFNYNDTGLLCGATTLYSTGVLVGETHEGTSTCTVLQDMNKTFSIYTTCVTGSYTKNSSVYTINISYSYPGPEVNTNLSNYAGRIDWPQMNFDVNISLGENWNETPQCSLQDNVSWIDCNPKYNVVSLNSNSTTV